jgi:rhodanese-related sulfurtransferase
LDVRETWEREVCALPNSLHIPMGQIQVRAAELQNESEIVVICHHGIRSRQAAELLEQMGFTNLYSLAGGIDAWARDVEPAMPRY